MPFPPEVSTCVDNECAHDACRPAIDFSVELMYASSVFQVPELASLSQVSTYSGGIATLKFITIHLPLCIKKDMFCF